MLRKTTESFKQEMKLINPDIIILGEYQGYKTKIKYQCKKGHINYATPDSLLHKHGCRICNGGAVKTQEEFESSVYCVNPNIKIIGQYVNYTTPIKCECLIHHKVIYPYPTSLLRGGGCSLCRDEYNAEQRKKTLRQFKDDLSKVNCNIEVLGNTYVNAYTKILCKCLNCQYIWNPTPHNVLRGEGCPICGNRKF